MNIDLISLIVPNYDAAISFFVDALRFTLAEDSPALTSSDGRPKRWVVVRPPPPPPASDPSSGGSVGGGSTGILLAQADGPEQERTVGAQFAGRVGLFLRVRDFQAQYDWMKGARVEFLGVPRDEKYGRVVVFKDLMGNRWDLLGPPAEEKEEGGKRGGEGGT